jgi:superfamily II DNA or RNA helicase
MTYFKNNYNEIRYPIADDANPGMRNAQIGAISAINSHFTVHDKEPAIVVMPTGSGKTAVLFISAFTQRATRVLIITPSKLVRNQIAEGMKDLSVLKNAGVIRQDITLPKVAEITKVVDGAENWETLKDYDVVVSTPNSIVADLTNFNPPEDLFDLILIDEAHHSPAKTWDQIFKGFKKSKKILFTATPFRRDKKEIKGKIVYNYPIARAYEDKIFGEVEFVAVTPDAGTSSDITIAKKVSEIFETDMNAGLEHYVMIRTNTKKHAKELVAVYEENTGLKLKRIDSTMSSKNIKAALQQLKDKAIHGVICVDMLGEGFDFPNLKIAGIHNPHKSLAITLQFIGRFARTNADKIGGAKFVGVPAEIEFFKQELYSEGAVWQEIIKEISHSAIQEEVEIKETFEKFENKDLELEDDIDISLYSLNPYHHVKIYDASNIVVNINTELKIPGNSIEKHFVSEELSTIILITKEVHKPKWLSTDELIDVKYNLYVIYFDNESQLLFINASKKTIETYNQIAKQLLGTKPKRLPLSLVHKVLLDYSQTEVFNLGLRSTNAYNNAESYIIKSGSHVQNAIKSTDILSYEGGHTFLRGKDGEEQDYSTIGYSSSSKVWSNENSKINKFIEWCKGHSRKITSDQDVVTNTNLDKITIKSVIDQIPLGIVFGSWHSKCYKSNYQYVYRTQTETFTGTLIDLDIDIVYAETDQNTITYLVSGPNFSEKFTFTIADFHTRVDKTAEFKIELGDDDYPEIEAAINDEFPVAFFLKNFSSIVLNEISKTSSTNMNFDTDKITPMDWSDTDIMGELVSREQGKYNIHEKIRLHLNSLQPNVLFYDHGTGETADFITIRETQSNILVDFYHCKGSGGRNPGNRVDDVYEVCGQAIKSCYYASPKELIAKIEDRNGTQNSTFQIGDIAEVRRMFDSIKMPKFCIHAVQPGINKANVETNISEVLAGADSYIDRGDNVQFRVLASENILTS